MRDIIAVAVVLAFFCLCTGYVAFCDRIIGEDEPDVSSEVTR